MMSRVWIIALLLLAMGSVTASVTVRAADVPVPPLNADQSRGFMPSCAPWGGESLNVAFPVGSIGAKFEGVIWGKGLIAFRSGKSFTIDNVVGPEGTGRAQIVVMKRDPSAVPDMTEVTARFDPPAQPDGPWAVAVHVPKQSDQDLMYFLPSVIPDIQPVCE